MTIDPRLLGLVLAIVEHGTFNRAAKALGISQPALSKSVALLEHRLGEKIFERGARGSTLTDAGVVIARSARNMRHILKRATDEIRANSKRVHGPIVIGATPSMMLGLVPQALAGLAQHGPMLVTIREDLDDQLTPALLRGEIDLLIGPIEGLHAAPAGIIQTPLAREPFCIAFPPRHRLARVREVRLTDLKEEAWILPPQGSSFHRTVEALFLAAGLPWPSDVIETNTLHAHERLVMMTGRVAIVTTAQLLGGRTKTEIVPLAGAPLRAIGVRRQEGVQLNPLADQLIDQLREVIRASSSQPTRHKFLAY